MQDADDVGPFAIAIPLSNPSSNSNAQQSAAQPQFMTPEQRSMHAHEAQNESASDSDSEAETVLTMPAAGSTRPRTEV